MVVYITVCYSKLMIANAYFLTAASKTLSDAVTTQGWLKNMEVRDIFN